MLSLPVNIWMKSLPFIDSCLNGSFPVNCCSSRGQLGWDWGGRETLKSCRWLRATVGNRLASWVENVAISFGLLSVKFAGLKATAHFRSLRDRAFWGLSHLWPFCHRVDQLLLTISRRVCVRRRSLGQDPGSAAARCPAVRRFSIPAPKGLCVSCHLGGPSLIFPPGFEKKKASLFGCPKTCSSKSSSKEMVGCRKYA